VEDVIVAPSVRELDVLASQLRDWLAGKLPEARDLTIKNLSYPFGAGMSHETILFDAAWSEGGEPRERGLVVRIKPTSNTVYPDDLYEKQYQVMRALNADGRVRVAPTHWLETDPSLLGSPFFIMEKRVGRVPVSMPPYCKSGWLFEATPAQRRKVWENGMRQLAAMQLVPLDKLSFLADDDGTQGLEQEWRKYERFVEWISREHRWKALDAAVERLRATWPVNQPPGLVWGDARIGNMMFDADLEVAAVMDWEQPSLGGALHDLTWWVHHASQFHPDGFEGFGDRAETYAFWQEITGVSIADIEWYEGFTALKFACLGTRMYDLNKGFKPTEELLRERLAPALAL
jgi:aminoglycoside phosphotransferase (APT) family kinase protein